MHIFIIYLYCNDCETFSNANISDGRLFNEHRSVVMEVSAIDIIIDLSGYSSFCLASVFSLVILRLTHTFYGPSLFKLQT